jgi:hypothetical protein
MRQGKEVTVGKLRIRGCTHCKNGEMFIDRDMYGWYECCLQCGYSHDLPEIAQSEAVAWKNREKVGLPVKKGRSLL